VKYSRALSGGSLIVVRKAMLPDDAAQIASMDISFTTDQVYTAERDGDQLALRLLRLATPVRKTFPLDDLCRLDRPWELRRLLRWTREFVASSPLAIILGTVG
jgi:hypothetical protein